MKKTAIVLLLALGFTYGTVSAQQPGVVISDKTGWHKIGETKVDFKQDHDEVLVIGSDRFATIKFKVTEAPIDLLSVEIFYESGDNQKVKVGYQIKSAGESRTIDLNGGERNLKKIVFNYKTLPNRKDDKAHVEIYGKKTNTDKK